MARRTKQGRQPAIHTVPGAGLARKLHSTSSRPHGPDVLFQMTLSEKTMCSCVTQLLDITRKRAIRSGRSAHHQLLEGAYPPAAGTMSGTVPAYLVVWYCSVLIRAAASLCTCALSPTGC